MSSLYSELLLDVVSRLSSGYRSHPEPARLQEEMADPLYELLAPHLPTKTLSSSSTGPQPYESNNGTSYLARLTTLSLSVLSTTEPQSLAQSSNSNILSLQALSSRSHKSVIATSNSLSRLGEYLPTLTSSASDLRDGVPELDEKALSFSQKYSKSNAENAVLDRRKKAMLLSRNVDRMCDILELPALLATAIASSSTPASSSSSAPSGVNYSQALDLFAHIKRLPILHPDSLLVQSVLTEAEEAMKEMTSNLITSLRGQNVRLAAAIRTIGWLRRVAPDLAAQGASPSSTKVAQSSTYTSTGSPLQPNSEGSFGYLFLVCRLYNLLNMLEALAPLRDLADQETQQRLDKQNNSVPTSASLSQTGAQRKMSAYGHSAFAGHQTERYLKRYIEIFREQSFAIISMYKNIFPAGAENTANAPPTSPTHTKSSLAIQSPSHPSEPPPILILPTPLATFPTHLISLLTETLRQYLPNLTDPSARDSLLMQVLYAAGSLGRLGADFSMVIADLVDGDSDSDDSSEDEESEREGSAVAHKEAQAAAAENENENTDNSPAPAQHPEKDKPPPEWIRILQKHRLQSTRLQALSASQGQAPEEHTSNRPLPLMRKGSSQDAVVK